MFRSSHYRKLAAAALCVALATLIGCASAPKPAVCAVVGGVLGGGGGWLLGNETPAPDGKEEAIYGGAGAILGASTGYLICRAMQKEEAPPPPETRAAPPPPPPPPAPAPVEEKIVLRGVNFDFDKADIRQADQGTLDRKAAVLVANPNVKLRISGHADERGSDEYNLALGNRRAAAAKRYLESKGVDGGRMEVVSYGEERPLNPGSDEDAYAQNRRDEFEVTAGGDNLVAPQ